MTERKVAEVVLNRAIEQLGETAKIPDKEVGALKGMISGLFVRGSTVESAVEYMRQAILDKLSVHVNANLENYKTPARQEGVGPQQPTAQPGITTPAGETLPADLQKTQRDYSKRENRQRFQMVPLK